MSSDPTNTALNTALASSIAVDPDNAAPVFLNNGLDTADKKQVFEILQNLSTSMANVRESVEKQAKYLTKYRRGMKRARTALIEPLPSTSSSSSSSSSCEEWMNKHLADVTATNAKATEFPDEKKKTKLGISSDLPESGDIIPSDDDSTEAGVELRQIHYFFFIGSNLNHITSETNIRSKSHVRMKVDSLTRMHCDLLKVRWTDSQTGVFHDVFEKISELCVQAFATTRNPNGPAVAFYMEQKDKTPVVFTCFLTVNPEQVLPIRWFKRHLLPVFEDLATYPWRGIARLRSAYEEHIPSLQWMNDHYKTDTSAINFWYGSNRAKGLEPTSDELEEEAHQDEYEKLLGDKPRQTTVFDDEEEDEDDKE